MRNPPLFEFESSDALAQFSVWAAPIVAAPLVLDVLHDFGLLTWRSALIGAALLTGLISVIVAGLRSRIVIFPDRVVVERKWFRLRYYKIEGSCVQHVFFGGDCGDDFGAHGVVFDLDGRKVHIGNARNMHFLHVELNKLACTRKGAACWLTS